MPFLGLSVLQGFLFWLFGAAASLLSERIAIHRTFLASHVRFVLLGLGLLMVIPAILLGKTFLGAAGNSFLAGLPVALSFAFLVVAFSPALSPPAGLGREFLGGFTRRLSESSFSLYVLHFPLICALVPRISPSQNAALEPLAMAQFAGMFLVCVLSAVAFASLTEWKTPELRRWVMHRLQPA
jgi:peptidoglycan/LPS O-acetylase OafA/YrhL